jgi:hypothetical protein
MYAITVKGDTKTFEVTGPTLIIGNSPKALMVCKK